MRDYFDIVSKNILFRLSRYVNFPLISPDTLQLNFLYRCNLNCRMCTISQREDTVELSLEVMKSLVDQAKDMNVKEVLFLGGEPFLSDNFFPIVEYVKRKGMIAIVITNGTLFTKENLERMKVSGLDHIVISLDASSEEILSSIRGKGIFGQIQDSIARFWSFKRQEPDFHAGISNCVTIMDQNIEDLYNIIQLSRQMGFYDVIFQPVIFDNTNQILKGEICNTAIPRERMEIMESAVDAIIDFKKINIDNYDYIINSIRNLSLIKKYFSSTLKRTERACYIGFNRIQISQDRKVYFCAPVEPSAEVSFGDVSRDTVRDLWYSRRARDHRRAIRRQRCCCMQRCAYREGFERIEGVWEKLRYFGKVSL